MELTAEYIQSILEGKYTIPLASKYDFNMETEKVIKKAKADKRFVNISKTLFVWDLLDYPDGRYVGDEFVGFKLNQDWILFVENDTESLMIATEGVEKVISVYFSDVEISNNSTITRARIMKTYFHYFKKKPYDEPIHRRRRIINDEEFAKLVEIFKSQEFTEFKNTDDFEKYYDGLPENEPTISVLKVDDTYTFMVKQDQDVGFHFILGNKENVNILEFNYFPKKEKIPTPFNFLDVYAKASSDVMPDAMRQLIAYCYKGIKREITH